MKKNLLLIIVLTVVGFAYLPLFQNQFVIDDKTFIIDWQAGHNLANLGDFFKGSVPAGHEGVYRPLRSVLYAIYYFLWGTNSFGYHLHGLLINLIATALVFKILEHIFGNKNLAFAGSLIFGLHPVHAEAISYISASMDTTGTVFFLASFLFYLKSSNSANSSGPVRLYPHSMSSVVSLPAGTQRGAPAPATPRKKVSLAPRLPSPLNAFDSYLFAFLAFFTYEMTLTLPLLIVFYDFCFKKKGLLKNWKTYLPYFLLMLSYFLIRILAIGGSGRGQYLDNNIFLTFLAGVKVFFEYLTLTVLPINLMHNHIIPRGIEAILYRGHNLAPIISQNFLDWEFLLSLGTILALCLMAWKFYKKYPIITFGIGWFFVVLLPVSNIIPQWSLMHERFLYLPSFGIILIFIYLCSFIKKQQVFKILVFLLAAIFFVLTVLRIGDWKDGITLWQRDIKTNSFNPYAYFQLGESLALSGQKDKAIEAYKKAFEQNPGFAVAIASAARTYQQEGEKEKAIEHYQKAVSADPNFWEGTLILEDLTKQSYQSNLGFSFSYPGGWSVEKGFKNDDLRITNEDKSFSMAISLDEKNKKTPEDYLKIQTESYGALINEGSAQIPNFDKSFVKVFSDQEANPSTIAQGSEQVQRMLFYLFKDDKVIKILVYPANSTLMKQFDSIVESFKFS